MTHITALAIAAILLYLAAAHQVAAARAGRQTLWQYAGRKHPAAQLLLLLAYGAALAVATRLAINWASS